MFRFFKNIGPGTLVAAAFIGPGTVTVCSIAGVSFGYALLWAMLFSVGATIFLQEMSARIGIVTGRGLAELIKDQIKHPFFRSVSILLILLAIVLGNTAYEAGNIGGASLGLEALFGNKIAAYYPLFIGFLTSSILLIGNYKLLERILVVLVLIMSISFLLTALITKPDIIAIIKGMFIPTLPEESLFTVVALIGTTVVPYNLFLHASLVSEKWKDASDLSAVRKDTYISIALGGIVSMSIIIAATGIQSDGISGILDLAQGLEPLFGKSARYFLGIGLMAAGTTSAITAPLAAAYVVNHCFGWKASLKDWRFCLVWLLIIFLGVLFLSFDINLIEIIKIAQVANGILLSVIAGFLLWLVNRKLILGTYKNSGIQNIIGFIIIGVTLLLGTRSILKVFGIL